MTSTVALAGVRLGLAGRGGRAGVGRACRAGGLVGPVGGSSVGRVGRVLGKRVGRVGRESVVWVVRVGRESGGRVVLVGVGRGGGTSQYTGLIVGNPWDPC